MKYILEKDVRVPMAEGAELTTDIWRPDDAEPVPALLMRTPYSKDDLAVYGHTSPNVFTLLRAGYAVVTQDVRGTFGSDGTFAPHVAEAEDTAEMVRWLARQDWCTGAVGGWGGSYLGMVQWQAAATGVPELKALAPCFSTADVYSSAWYTPGGAMCLDTVVRWPAMMGINELTRALAAGKGDPTDIQALLAQFADPAAGIEHTPVADRPVLAKYLPSVVEGGMAHPERDEHWKPLIAIDSAESITAPALNIGGWYDFFLGETLNAFTTMRRSGGSPEAREGQQLVVGPWSHAHINGYFPDRHFGVAASFVAADLTTTHIAFYDRWLKGHEDALNGRSPVRIFVMGIDQWRDEPDWPLPDTTYIPYYLSGEGPANTIAGAGTLSPVPSVHDVTDRYLYDPARPVRTLGGTLMELSGFDGAADQRTVHQRDDVLCFQTEVLSEPIEVTGHLSAVLYVSSSAVDTDFTAKLVDLHPDGRAIILCDGIQRMRYRMSLQEPELMTPGEIYEITIDLLATSNVFLPGHRILLEISSSNFPRYDRNSNTGGAIAQEHLADMVTATNALHRGVEYPSQVILPVIDR